MFFCIAHIFSSLSWGFVFAFLFLFCLFVCLFVCFLFLLLLFYLFLLWFDYRRPVIRIPNVAGDSI